MSTDLPKRLKPRSLYHEVHVTVEPPKDELQLQVLKLNAQRHGFRLADLVMVRHREATEQRSNRDAFMTLRCSDLAVACAAVEAVVRDLRNLGFAVWRYKIEDTIVDSNQEDALELGVTKNATPH